MLAHKGPLIMGGMMGLMLPWMMHMEQGGTAGVLFVLTHVALVLVLLALALFVPAVRARVSRVRTHLSHLPTMTGAVALGWAATCTYCLMIGGLHWT